MKKKRKPWRRYRTSFLSGRQIRCLCLLILAVELAVLEYQKAIPTIEIKENHEIIISHFPDECEENGKQWSSDRIYGIRIRLKEGVIDFYRREEQKE